MLKTLVKQLNFLSKNKSMTLLGHIWMFSITAVFAEHNHSALCMMVHSMATRLGKPAASHMLRTRYASGSDDAPRRRLVGGLATVAHEPATAAYQWEASLTIPCTNYLINFAESILSLFICIANVFYFILSCLILCFICVYLFYIF